MGVGTIKHKALFYGALILKKETGLPMGVIPNKYREYWNPPLTPKPIF